MIDPEKYMIVMAAAVIPRKKLGHHCGECGRRNDAVQPLAIATADGLITKIDPQIFIGTADMPAGRWGRLRTDGVPIEQAAREALDRLLKDADELLAMPDGNPDGTEMAIRTAIPAEEA